MQWLGLAWSGAPDPLVAECPTGVSESYLRSGFGDDDNIDKNSPKMNNPATRPEINITFTPHSPLLMMQFTCQRFPYF